jgi:hypothetical protein
MAIPESITQEAWTQIHWTMVLVEGIMVVQSIVPEPVFDEVMSARC